MTNRIIETKDELTQLVYRYSSRWRIEEYYRFKKSELGFEDFRVKSLDSINNLTFSLDLAIVLMAIIIEEESNYLYFSILKNGKKIKETVSIEFYGILSGINTTLSTNKNGVKNYKPIRDSKPKQLSLFKIYDFI